MEVGPRGLAFVAGEKRAEFLWVEVARVGPTTGRPLGVGPTTALVFELAEMVRAGPTSGRGLAGGSTATALVIEPVRHPRPGTGRRRGSLTYSVAMRGYPVMYLGMNGEKWFDVGVAVQRYAPAKWSSADRARW